MTSLWHHQAQAVNFLLPLPAGALLMDMGTGKSRCAIELLNRWQTKRTLIICPKSVIQVWVREFAKHAPDWHPIPLEKGSILQRKHAADQALKSLNGHKVALIINYESCWRSPIAEWFMTNLPEVVICDEVHRLKQPGGVASRFIARLGKLVRRRLGLTGTICPHSPLDIYGSFRFLKPSLFGYSFVQFRSRYAVMGGYQGHQVLDYVNLEELHRKVYSISYRCEAKDVLDLPEEIDETITFDLSPKAMKVYKELEKELISYVEESGESISASTVLVKLLRLAQITGGWIKTDDGQQVRLDTAKSEALEDLLDGMGQEPVVIFCRFTKDLDTCKEVCDRLKLTWAELSGQANDLPRFEEGKAQVLIAQIKSGGVGVDLTRARYTIFYSLGFSLGDYLQARKRTHRPGQTRAVTYYHLCAEKTVDEKILKAIAKRAEIVNYLVDALRDCR
jgi:SNF2 family DNA or RNA helicase